EGETGGEESYRQEGRGEESGCEEDVREKERGEESREAASGEGSGKEARAEEGRGETRERQRLRVPCAEQGPMGWSRQGARRREDPRLHARAVGTDLHAAARLYGRGLHQD